MSRPDALSSSYFTFVPVGISMMAGTGSSTKRGSSTSCHGCVGKDGPPRTARRARDYLRSARRWGNDGRSDPAAVLEARLAHLRLGHAAAGRHPVGEPDVAADGGALPDGDAAEDGRARVDDHVVLDDGVPVDALDGRALLVLGEALRAQRHALVEPDVGADDGRLADHDARAVVDEEALVDACARVDVDPGQRVRVLGDHA